jgi:hypothetical protein
MTTVAPDFGFATFGRPQEARSDRLTSRRNYMSLCADRRGGLEITAPAHAAMM